MRDEDVRHGFRSGQKTTGKAPAKLCPFKKKQKIKNRPIQAGLLQKENAPPNPLRHGAKESSPSAADDISADQILHTIFGSGEGGAGFS